MKYVAIINATTCRQFDTEAEAKAAYPNATVMSDEDHVAKRTAELKTEAKVVMKQPIYNWFQRKILKKKIIL
jgi:FMN-dependent NADH-azoreductase